MVNNRQISTNIYQNKLFSKLKLKHQEAIIAALKGNSYKQIARNLDVQYTTVKAWFQYNGVCRKAYDELLFENTRNNLAEVEKTRDKLFTFLPEALDTILDSVKRENWRAAVSILDRAGY